MKRWILLVVLFGNWWIWKVFSFNFLTGITLVFVTILLYRLTRKYTKNTFTSFTILFLLLLFFQFKTTGISSLTLLSNDDIRVRDMRLREYPPLKIPVGWWFEGRKESIAFFRILKNFSEVIDPNLYFFANHPRERVGFIEFEKFHFVFIPFFLLGIFKLIDQNKILYTFLSFILSVLLILTIGNYNPIGPFSLFPAISVTTIYGAEYVYKKFF